MRVFVADEECRTLPEVGTLVYATNCSGRGRVAIVSCVPDVGDIVVYLYSGGWDRLSNVTCKPIRGSVTLEAE